MEPLSITAAAGSLAASIFALVKFIGSFVTTVRNSRTELEAVSRELVSLQVCLEVLESDRRNGTLFGNELEVSVKQVLVNVQMTCGQIESMLATLKSTRFGRTIKWAVQQKDQMTEFRSSLETHKSALQIALQLNTISIVIKETQNLRAPQSPLLNVGQADKTYSAIQQINQKVDKLASAQEQSLVLQRLQDAMADLSSTVHEAVSSHEGLALLAQQSCLFADEKVATVENISGVQEIRTKLGGMVRDPFADPFNEVKGTSENQLGGDLTQGSYSSRDIDQCVLCSHNISDGEKAPVQAKLH